MRIYKVARVRADGTFGSAMAFYRPLDDTERQRWLDNFDLDYVLGQRTVPVEGTVGILVFVSQDLAVSFARDEPCYLEDYVVLRCEAPQGATPITWIAPFWYEALWTDPAIQERQAMRAPPGSYVVPELTPLEVVFSTVKQQKEK